MMKSKLLLLFLVSCALCVSYVGHAEPRPSTKASRIAALTDQAFGSIWIDSDMEDADVESEVRAALDSGLSPNARDQYGETLLIQAIENSRLSVLRLLLAKGANVNLPDTKLGDTPLIRASYTNDIAAKVPQPSLAVVQALLKKRADPNRRNKAGDTALTMAVALGHGDIVAALLKAGANFRLKNKQGFTALKLASTPVPRGSISIVSMPYLTRPNDPKQVEKDMRDHEKMLEQMARAEEKRLATGRAKAKRLLQAAGAKE